MKIPCEEIAAILKKEIISEVKLLKKKNKHPQLATILVGDSKDQISFVASKKKIGESLGIEFNFIHYKEAPAFMRFIKTIKTLSDDPKNTAVIIQQPLPSKLYTETLYDFVSLDKEIESHKNKINFYTSYRTGSLNSFKIRAYPEKSVKKTDY